MCTYLVIQIQNCSFVSYSHFNSVLYLYPRSVASICVLYSLEIDSINSFEKNVVLIRNNKWHH